MHFKIDLNANFYSFISSKAKKEGLNCNNALSRVIGFAVADLDTGAATAAITGKTQTFFDGSDKIDGFQVAWAIPYLTFDKAADRDTMQQLATKYAPLNDSKLGGDQALIWAGQN